MTVAAVFAVVFGGVVLALSRGAEQLGVAVPELPVVLVGAALGAVASPPVREAVERVSPGRFGVAALAVSAVLVSALLLMLGLGVLVPAVCVSAAGHATTLVPTRARLVQSAVVVVLTSLACWGAQELGWVDGLLPASVVGLLGTALLAISAPMVVNTTIVARQAQKTALALEEVRREHVAVLQHAADHDALTAVLFVDLDGFKAVNDAHGHAAGDELLVVVAGRLRGCVRPPDLVSRTGGYEFVLLLSGLRRAGEAEEVARRVRAAVGAEVVLSSGVGVRVGASTGIAVAAGPRPADALLDEADAAMYAEKLAGRSVVEVPRER